MRSPNTPPDQVSTTFTLMFPDVAPPPEELFDHQGDFYTVVYDAANNAIPAYVGDFKPARTHPIGFGPNDKSSEDRIKHTEYHDEKVDIVELTLSFGTAQTDPTYPERPARPFRIETPTAYLHGAGADLLQKLQETTPSQQIGSILLSQAQNDDGTPIHHTYDVCVGTDQELTDEDQYMVTQFLIIYVGHVQRRIQEDQAKRTQLASRP